MKRALLVIVSLVLGVGAAEVAARLMPLLPINVMGAVMQPDPILDHSLRPGSFGRMKGREYNVTYRINSSGLRDDYIVASDSETVLILGDSFMEGYGVERGEILADVLERRTGWNVINGGVKSYSPLLHYLFLKHRGLALNPDTVILFLDLSDPANDVYYTRRLVRGDDGKPERITPRIETNAFLHRNSVLYSHLVHLALKYGASEDKGYSGIGANLDLLFPGRDSVPDTDYFSRWERSFEYLLEIRDLLSSRKVGFILVTYPYGHQVAADAWKEGRVAHGFPPGISSDRPFRFVEHWADSESIAIVSLDLPFRHHPRPGPLYFTWDGHWTPAGHSFAADALLAVL